MANSKIDSLKVGDTTYDITLPADADLSVTNLSITGSFNAPTLYTKNIVGCVISDKVEYGSLTLTTSGYNGGILISAPTAYCSLTMKGLDIYALAGRSVTLSAPTSITLSGSNIEFNATASITAPDIYLGSITSSRKSVLNAIDSLGTQVTYSYSSNVLTITTK